MTLVENPKMVHKSTLGVTPVVTPAVTPVVTPISSRNFLKLTVIVSPVVSFKVTLGATPKVILKKFESPQ